MPQVAPMQVYDRLGAGVCPRPSHFQLAEEVVAVEAPLEAPSHIFPTMPYSRTKSESVPTRQSLRRPFVGTGNKQASAALGGAPLPME